MDEDNNQEHESVIREVEERIPRSWPLLLLYAVSALIVAAIVVFGIRAIYRHEHPIAKAPSTTATKTSPERPSTPSSSASSSTTGSTSSTSSNLPNSGPGQVFGLFIGSAMAASGLHYLINYRRGSKSTN